MCSIAFFFSLQVFPFVCFRRPIYRYISETVESYIYNFKRRSSEEKLIKNIDEEKKEERMKNTGPSAIWLLS